MSRDLILGLAPVTVGRWQFGITTVYHFLFVPLTIGLAPIVAVLHTLWYRTGEERWLRQTRFWGKLFLINFAMGVVTGIVQEFQFGMAWSNYSRFVGDIFGAPLAMEGLAAFFLESTFIGIWIFGWDRIPKRLHLASIWAAAIGVNLSAYFILAANSWMQHPVGVRFNAERGRAELTSIWEVLSNSTVLAAFPHTIFGALMTAAAFLVGISAWQLAKHRTGATDDDRDTFLRVLRGAAALVMVAGLGVAVSGHFQARLMFKQQPMKMAAAEALCDSEKGAGFSIFAIGDVGKECNVRTLSIPGATSFLATDRFDSTIKGVKDVNAEYRARYGDADYRPNLMITYWSFRLMIGIGMAAAAVALWAWLATRRDRTPTSRWFTRLALAAIAGPFLGNSLGWIFTEMGRQPWVVAPNPNGIDAVRMLTYDAGSPALTSPTLMVSLVTLTAVYGILAVVELKLLKQTIDKGPDGTAIQLVGSDGTPDNERLSFAY